MRFEVKIDLWLKLVLYLSGLMILPFIFFVPADERLMITLIALLNGAIILPFALVGYYELREEYLFIRFGFIYKKIQYKYIDEVKESKGFTNSYALSKDRVRIKVSNKPKVLAYTEISPEDKERFIFELKSRCIQLKEVIE